MRSTCLLVSNSSICYFDEGVKNNQQVSRDYYTVLTKFPGSTEYFRGWEGRYDLQRVTLREKEKERERGRDGQMEKRIKRRGKEGGKSDRGSGD